MIFRVLLNLGELFSLERTFNVGFYTSWGPTEFGSIMSMGALELVTLTFGKFRVRVRWAKVGNMTPGSVGTPPAQVCTPASGCSSLTQERGGDVLRDLVS